MPEDNKDEPPLKKMFQRWADNPPPKRHHSHSGASEPILDANNSYEEVSKQMASRLAAQELEIIELAKTFDRSTLPVNNPLRINIGFGCKVSLNTSEMTDPTGKPSRINLYKYPENKTESWYPTNVKSNTVLEINSYGERKNIEEYSKWIAAGKPKNFLTSYFFDAEGSYGKIQSVPDGFKHDAKVIEPSENIELYVTGAHPPQQIKSKTVEIIEGTMTPEDFELAQTALHLLKDALTKGPDNPEPIT